MTVRLEAPRLELAGMPGRDVAVIAAGAAYLAAFGWATIHQPFDVWGAFVALPIIAVVGTVVVRVMFRGDAQLVRIALVGLAVKIAGTFVRYWITFDTYGGVADSASYHERGRLIAGDIRSFVVGPWRLVPHGSGTGFIESLTGTLYTLVGSSRLAGFLWFSMFGFVGVLLFVKAATVAAPAYSIHRYAFFCALSPSLAFWPSSIGKEAWMSLSLGVLTYGIARLFAGRSLPVSLGFAVAGAVGAAVVRPHIAAVWVGSAAVAAVWAAVGRRADRSRGRSSAVLVAVAGIAGLVVVGRLALQFLEVDQSDSIAGQVTSALQTVSDRTAQGGSEFTPPSIASPLDYPWAVLRTITRPLPHEVSGLSSLLPALETTAIIVIAVLGLSRWRSLPGLLRRSPYTVFNVLVVVSGALAYSTFSNLAILVRQRSLLMPSILLLLCMPVFRHPAPRPPATRDPVRTAAG